MSEQGYSVEFVDDLHAQIAALTTKVAELEALVERTKAAWDSSHRQAMENGAAANANRQDAARYRFIRRDWLQPFGIINRDAKIMTGDAADAAIDAAIAAEQSTADSGGQS